MTVLQNRTTSDAPWRDAALQKPTQSMPDDAVIEGGDGFWIRGVAPDLHIFCSAGGRIFEVQRENAEYPDEIYDREQTLMRAYREGPGL